MFSRGCNGYCPTRDQLPDCHHDHNHLVQLPFLYINVCMYVCSRANYWCLCWLLLPDEMNTSDLRLRLYSYERLRRERMIGECLVAFDSLGVQKPAAAAAGDSTSHPVVEQWFTLTPRSNMNVRISQSTNFKLCDICVEPCHLPFSKIHCYLSNMKHCNSL
jgi:hypothetical protein